MNNATNVSDAGAKSSPPPPKQLAIDRNIGLADGLVQSHVDGPVGDSAMVTMHTRGGLFSLSPNRCNRGGIVRESGHAPNRPPGPRQN